MALPVEPAEEEDEAEHSSDEHGDVESVLHLVLQKFYNGVTGVFQECYRRLRGMSLECHSSVTVPINVAIPRVHSTFVWCEDGVYMV
jgi:hypothetical protein